MWLFTSRVPIPSSCLFVRVLACHQAPKYWALFVINSGCTACRRNSCRSSLPLQFCRLRRSCLYIWRLSLSAVCNKVHSQHSSKPRIDMPRAICSTIKTDWDILRDISRDLCTSLDYFPFVSSNCLSNLPHQCLLTQETPTLSSNLQEEFWCSEEYHVSRHYNTDLTASSQCLSDWRCILHAEMVCP